MTEEMTIEQQNEMIARFMEVERDVNTWRHPYGATVYLVKGYWHPARKLQYHSSWDWLMPVVLKINEMEGEIYAIHLDADTIYVHRQGEEMLVYDKSLHGSMIAALYQAVVDFIKWYNENKQPK